MAELIKSRPDPVRIPARQDAPARELVEELFSTEQSRTPRTHRLRPAKDRQLAKLTGIGVAMVVLCCSIATASLINSNRAAGTTEAAIRPAVELTGKRALIPDLFDLGRTDLPDDQVSVQPPAPKADGTAADTAADTGTTGQDATANGSERQGGPGAVAAPADQTTAAASAPGTVIDPKPESRTEVVRRFYGLLDRHPDQALGLLDGSLRLSTVPQFVTSWREVRDIDLVEVRERQDGSVQAVVDMVLPNDRRMRVQQLLWFTDSTPPRIREAKVISAQHS